MYNYSFPFFFSVNNTGYPANNYKNLILSNLRFSWIKSLSACYLTSINLYIGKNLRLILGSKLII